MLQPELHSTNEDDWETYDSDYTNESDESPERIGGQIRLVKAIRAVEKKSILEDSQKEELQSCPTPSEIGSKAFDSKDEFCKH